MVHRINNSTAYPNSLIPANKTAITRFSNRSIKLIPKDETDLSKTQSVQNLKHLLYNFFPNEPRSHIDDLLSQTTNDIAVKLLQQKSIKII